MRFGECYEHLEDGGFVTRKGWENGSFLWLKKKAMKKVEPDILSKGKKKSDYVADLFEGVDIIKKP